MAGLTAHGDSRKRWFSAPRTRTESEVAPIFRPTRALRHDTLHCPLPAPHVECVPGPGLSADRVLSEWRLMYHVMQRDPELAEVCGFTDAEISRDAQRRRLAQLRTEVALSGGFEPQPHEMQFWVRFAWMSSDRCSGRQHALQHAVIRYLPEVQTAAGMLEAAVTHAKIAMDAKLPPQTVITILGGPATQGSVGQFFATEQLVRFAEDRAYHHLAEWLRARDPSLIRATGALGPFTVLPMIAVGASGDVAVGTAPEARQYLVDIPRPVHPDADEDTPDGDERFAKWTGVPLQTNFQFDIAGQRYCGIFNGWYVDEEVAIDLLDEERYDLIPEVAAAIFPRPTRLTDYRIAQVEYATLDAVQRGFRASGYRLNKLGASQSGFGHFRERFVERFGAEPPNDPAWTSNRIGSRYRRPSHSMPLVRQERGAALVRRQMSYRSLMPGAPIDEVALAG